jgi:hypothetical protein
MTKHKSDWIPNAWVLLLSALFTSILNNFQTCGPCLQYCTRFSTINQWEAYKYIMWSLFKHSDGGNKHLAGVTSADSFSLFFFKQMSAQNSFSRPIINLLACSILLIQ